MARFYVNLAIFVYHYSEVGFKALPILLQPSTIPVNSELCLLSNPRLTTTKSTFDYYQIFV